MKSLTLKTLLLSVVIASQSFAGGIGFDIGAIAEDEELTRSSSNEQQVEQTVAKGTQISADESAKILERVKREASSLFLEYTLKFPEIAHKITYVKSLAQFIFDLKNGPPKNLHSRNGAHWNDNFEELLRCKTSNDGVDCYLSVNIKSASTIIDEDESPVATGPIELGAAEFSLDKNGNILDLREVIN